MEISKCSIPPKITEDQIDAILNGQVSSEMHYHLEHCEYCLNRVKFARYAERQLRTNLHPAPDELIAYSANELPPEEIQRISSHVKYCKYCRREIEAWDSFSDIEDANPEPFSAKGTVARSSEILELSSPTPELARLRSASDEEPTFKFEAYNAEHQVMLSIMWFPLTRRITGFLAPEMGSGSSVWQDAVVVVYREESLLDTDVINNIGAFQLDDIGAGSLNILITSPDSRQLRFENLHLPAVDQA